jgi:hypothetical protein
MERDAVVENGMKGWEKLESLFGINWRREVPRDGTIFAPSLKMG